MLRKYIIAALLIAAITPKAQAAMLTNISGTVLVNRGEGFLEVSGVAAVKQGDRVLVRGKGHARIDYGDGCTAEIRANQSTVVSSPKNCEKIPLYSASTNSGVSLKDTPAVYPTEEGGEQQVHFIGGLVVVAGAAVIALHDNADKPASP